jgi:hypothetical protein
LAPNSPVIASSTEFPFRRLLRLTGLRWRYCNPLTHGTSISLIISQNSIKLQGDWRKELEGGTCGLIWSTGGWMRPQITSVLMKIVDVPAETEPVTFQIETLLRESHWSHVALLTVYHTYSPAAAIEVKLPISYFDFTSE